MTWDYLATPPAQAVIWVSLVTVTWLIAFYFLRKLRDRTNSADSTVDHLAKFREMRARGTLNEAEFRTVKSTLGQRLRNEIRQDSEPR